MVFEGNADKNQYCPTAFIFPPVCTSLAFQQLMLLRTPKYVTRLLPQQDKAFTLLTPSGTVFARRGAGFVPSLDFSTSFGCADNGQTLSNDLQHVHKLAAPFSRRVNRWASTGSALGTDALGSVKS